MDLRSALRSLRRGSAFVLFWGGGAALSWVMLPAVVLLPGTLAERRRRAQRVVGGGFTVFHDYMRVLRLIDYDPRRVSLGLPDGPCVVIANHPTLVDVTAILAAATELACVVKEEHYRGPVVGRLLRLCGHINGGDGASMTGGAVVHQAVERLAAGQPVLIFPEGTRSPPGGLGSFYRGAFEIARRSGVPLVPLLVTCEPPTLTKGEPWWRHPAGGAVLSVRPFDGLLPEDLEGPSRAAAARVEARYRQRLEASGAQGAGVRTPNPS